MKRSVVAITALLVLSTATSASAAGRRQILRAIESALYAQVERGQVEPHVCDCVIADCSNGTVLSCGSRVDLGNASSLDLSKVPLVANEPATDGQLRSCVACACNSNEAPVDLIASAICLAVP